MTNIIGKVKSVVLKSKDDEGVLKHQFEIKLEVLGGTEENIDAVRKLTGVNISIDIKRMQLKIDNS